MAKILVADDNSNIQKMVGLALKDQGIDVVAVGNGEAAVRKISDVRPDLVLADVFMPVRNGYEVCRYVKEDSSLSHIPVILLVGAFDPLDEQEAQRVGADGVLKKPFVPPDPLISMVKSALNRAGVPMGDAAAHSGKAPEHAPAASVKEMLTPGMSSKVSALSPAPIPEAEVEPLPEEFPAPAPSVKIAAGSQPVAFGSLLETPEAEEDLACTAKPNEALEAARNWGANTETEEEEEEATGHGGWRPGGLEGAREEEEMPATGQKDWREEGFHGSSPASISKGRRWTPAETTQLAEVAEAPSVGVSTLESKRSSTPAPFAGDAWAAALATTVEETVIGKPEAPVVLDQAPAVIEAPAETRPAVVEEKPAAAPSKEPALWAAPAGSPWEVEAKKASMFASTWDAPVPATPAAPEMRPSVAEAEKFLEEEPAAAVQEAASETSNAFVPQESASGATEFVAETQEAASEMLAAGSAYSSSDLLDANATQEIPVYAESESSYASAPLTGEIASHAVKEPAHTAEAQEEIVRAEEPVTAAVPAPAPVSAQQPDMDELVARVLAKMNPDVMQKVTQEILKPVIEALIKDELNAKK